MDYLLSAVMSMPTIRYALFIRIIKIIKIQQQYKKKANERTNEEKDAMEPSRH